MRSERSRGGPLVVGTRHPGALVILSALVGPLIFTGCSDSLDDALVVPTPEASSTLSASPTGEDFTGLEGFLSEYEDAVSDLAATLPAGEEIDPKPSGEWDPKGRYEPGAGEMQAAFQWQCAWITSYADAKGASDEAQVGVALEHLASWTSLDSVAPHVDDESKTIWTEQVIATARAGDDSYLLALGENC